MHCNIFTKSRCLPPYIKYTFHGCMEHKSEPKEHAKNIKFNDNNVILLGTMTKGHLFEYLRGPALKIEIHDRDPKECPKKKASIFGSRPDDQAICNVAYTGGLLENYSGFVTRPPTGSQINFITTKFCSWDKANGYAGTVGWSKERK